MSRVIKALVACAAFGAGAGPFSISAQGEDYADITGLVYIRIHTESIFEPAEDATVRLYKRTEATVSKWLSYDAETVDEDGYYLFDGVQMTGEGGLCEEYDWFKVEIEDVDMSDTAFERFAHKEPRNGDVRVDVILYKGWDTQTPPSGGAPDFGETGHFACDDEEGKPHLYTINPSKEGPSEATCPPGENGVYFSG